MRLCKKEFGITANDFSNVQDSNNNTIAISLHNCMIEEDYDYLVELLHEL